MDVVTYETTIGETSLCTQHDTPEVRSAEGCVRVSYGKHEGDRDACRNARYGAPLNVVTYAARHPRDTVSLCGTHNTEPVRQQLGALAVSVGAMPGACTACLESLS